MRRYVISAAALTFAVAAAQADAQQPRGRANGQAARAAARFDAMDTNRDGIIQRSEWRGSDQSFRTHDWNRDGVLSGDEIRIGAERGARPNDADFDSPDREYVFDDWTARGFTALDHNRDGRITSDEWHFERETFRRADHNRDGAVSRAEFLLEDALDDDRGDRFADLDADRNGRVTRAEWHGAIDVFNNLDANRDGAITRAEMMGNEAPPALFTSIDVNRDNIIAFDEWHWSRATFDQLDGNRDGRLTRQEFERTASQDTRSAAYRAGYTRGQSEARAQAHDDRVQNQGYDAEGQRELETADSGYEPRLGPKAEYQAGYRAGWMRGYPEGWRQP
jgi:Ca2+-binding EF-hand superfamily protein